MKTGGAVPSTECHCSLIIKQICGLYKYSEIKNLKPRRMYFEKVVPSYKPL